ncbi:MAG TPA: hypothetical protein VLL54_20910 [Pyrinomonadaceae bacterium]|nr:hypothetical protein [Pyrinomonadaceae bacterium]
MRSTLWPPQRKFSTALRYTATRELTYWDRRRPRPHLNIGAQRVISVAVLRGKAVRASRSAAGGTPAIPGGELAR